MTVQIVKDALQMAVNKRIYKDRSTIHHSDRGIQYCCPDFSEFAHLNQTHKYKSYKKQTIYA